MAPQRPRSSPNVLQILSKRRPKRAIERALQRRRIPILSRTETANAILNQVKQQAMKSLHVFVTINHINPLIAECAAINSKSYSWSKAKSLDSALTKRINTTRASPSPQFQYTTSGPATRVWIPRWPNENPFLGPSPNLPEDRHAKSREGIVRIIQDQEEATKEFFTIASTCRSWKRLHTEDKKWLVREHLSIALRLEGVEVLDWEDGCPGWKMEVYFQRAESWKGGWGWEIR